MASFPCLLPIADTFDTDLSRLSINEFGNASRYWFLIERDRSNFQRLRCQGWTVMRFWAHEVEHDLDAIVSEIVRRVEKARKDRTDGKNGQTTSDNLRRRS
jgi:hypothetical protein